jgi:hypothetical protein
MDDGGDLRRLEAEEFARDRLAHAYAVTVHRSQGSTVQRAHALEDGSGRELAFVKMSRAKDRSTVYVVADIPSRPKRTWFASGRRAPAGVGNRLWHPGHRSRRRRGQPAGGRPMRDALRRGRLAAERAAVATVIPPDPSEEIRTLEKDLRRIHRQREDLAAGTGRYADGPVGHALWELGASGDKHRPPEA